MERCAAVNNKLSISMFAIRPGCVFGLVIGNKFTCLNMSYFDFVHVLFSSKAFMRANSMFASITSAHFFGVARMVKAAQTGQQVVRSFCWKMGLGNMFVNRRKIQGENGGFVVVLLFCFVGIFRNLWIFFKKKVVLVLFVFCVD